MHCISDIVIIYTARAVYTRYTQLKTALYEAVQSAKSGKLAGETCTKHWETGLKKFIFLSVLSVNSSSTNTQVLDMEMRNMGSGLPPKKKISPRKP